MTIKNRIKKLNTPSLRLLAFQFLLIVIWFLLPAKKSIDNTRIDLFTGVDYAKIDSIVAGMTMDEKIGQLLFLQKQSVDTSNIDSVYHWIKTLKLGGVSCRTAISQTYVSNFSEISDFPVFIGNCAGNLIDSNFYPIPFPSRNAIEAVDNDSLRMNYYRLSSKIRKNKDVTFNFLPAFYVDSLSTDKHISAKELLQREIGWHELAKISNTFANQKLISSLPGFYGYSPEIKDTILAFSGVPMQSIIENKILSLYFQNKSLPDSITLSLMQSLQQKSYKGLVLCEVGHENKIEELFDSGADIFVVHDSVSTAFNSIRRLVNLKRFSERDINYKVKKVITAKYWLGLFDSIPPAKVVENKTDSISNLLLSRFLYEQSISLFNNKNKIVPLDKIDKRKIILIKSGENGFDVLANMMKQYAKLQIVTINNPEKIVSYVKKNSEENTIIVCLPTELPYNETQKLVDKIDSTTKNVILVDFNEPDLSASFTTNLPYIKAFGRSQIEQKSVAQLIFGGIPALGNSLATNMECDTTISNRVKYTIPEEVNLSSDILARIDTIAREAISKGATPGFQVFVAKQGKVIFNQAYGYHTYSKGNKVNVNSLYDIASVTKIAASTLSSMKMYDDKKISLNTTLKDCFKDTKIEYTRIKADTIIKIDTLKIREIPDLKKLVAQADTFHINDSIIVAIDTIIYKLTPKNNIFKVTFNDLLRHESGVLPSLPILNMYLYKAKARKRMQKDRLKKVLDSLSRIEITNNIDSLNKSSSSVAQASDTLKKDTIRYGFDRFYTREMTDEAAYQIAENMYLRKEYFDTLWIDIKQLPVHHTKVYQYSDVNMILVQQAIDSLNNKGMNEYFKEEFSDPLGLQRISYLPLEHYGKSEIVPSAKDRVWRSQMLHGYVHDPSAAFLGGVSGNAGLFSSAHDLGILFQMVLNKGTYGGKQYFSENTVNLFTKIQAGTARGLGFDTQMAQNIIAESAPNITYGHTGFTGCCVWVDPVNEIVFVFLSNRVHPSTKNWRLNTNKIRQRIHQTVYDAIIPENDKKEKREVKNEEYHASVKNEK